jgi:hypothetical protein
VQRTLSVARVVSAAVGLSHARTKLLQFSAAKRR